MGVRTHPIGLQGLCLPSFKTEERAHHQQQRHPWLNEWGKLTHLKQDLGAAPQGVQWTGGHGGRLHFQGAGEEWEVTSYKGEELTPGGLSSYQGNHRAARPLPPLS